MNATPPARRPVILCILDGWGLRDETHANAVAQGRTPVFDRLRETGPFTTLEASGAAVGLPDGQMGNSEVGHITIGAGRTVWMDLPRIDRTIAAGAFATRAPLQAFIARLRETGGAAHLMGLASAGGVHAHSRHLRAAAEALSAAGVPVRVHLFTDGRDTAPTSADTEIPALTAALAALPGVAVASISGRFYAMDRDQRWERTEAAWRAVALGEGAPAADAAAALAAARAAGETDEFITPRVTPAAAPIASEDGVFFINFRADRARQILSALLEPDFDGFDRGADPRPAAALGMASYSDRLDARMATLFAPETIADGLGAWAARHGKRQLRLAETEKYPHVTFFLNGGAETPLEGEERFMAPSPKVRTYDLKPEMAAADVRAALTNAVHNGSYDLIVANFANPDMVGHTGDLAAAITAVETVDAALGAAVEAVEAVGGALLAIADHGNCETMIDPETGAPHTAHTTNPVPAMLVGGGGARLREGGGLADVAPTLLALMGLPQPEAMTGQSLLTGAS